MFTISRKAPALATFQRWIGNCTDRQKCYFYQALIFVSTFVTYITYHINKRPFEVVKSVLSPSCIASSNNNTCDAHAWEPFTGQWDDRYLFGLLDFTFMISYAVSIFVSGYIAERTELRMFLTCGMILTSLSTALFGMIRPLGIHSTSYFFLMQLVGGVAQSTVLPAVIEMIGAWIPKGTSGIVYGVWSFHYPLGNIIGNTVSGSFQRDDWSLSFFLPAIIIFLTSIIIYVVLVPDPMYVGIRLNENCTETGKDQHNHHVTDFIGNNIKPEPLAIEFWDAFAVPGVIEYCLCLFFIKFVVYTFFYWFPFIMYDIVHDTGNAAYRLIVYDVGCGVGATAAGVIYDFTDFPAIICMFFLISGVPTVYQLFITGQTLQTFTTCAFLVGCLFGGPCTLITTVLAKRPSSRQLVSANTKSIATFAAIFGGFAYLGASAGPLVTGSIEARHRSWVNVSYLLVCCAVLGPLMLTRQCYNEVKLIKSSLCSRFVTKSDSYENENLLEKNEDELQEQN